MVIRKLSERIRSEAQPHSLPFFHIRLCIILSSLAFFFLSSEAILANALLRTSLSVHAQSRKRKKDKGQMKEPPSTQSKFKEGGSTFLHHLLVRCSCVLYLPRSNVCKAEGTNVIQPLPLSYFSFPPHSSHWNSFTFPILHPFAACLDTASSRS